MVTDFTELAGIQKWQRENLKKQLNKEEAASEGFVTAEYSLAFVETMHRAGPSIIAKDDDTVVGYALTELSGLNTIFYKK